MDAVLEFVFDAVTQTGGDEAAHTAVFLAVHVEQFVLYRFGQIRACLIVDLHEREAEVDATHNPRGIGLIEEDPVAIG